MYFLKGELLIGDWKATESAMKVDWIVTEMCLPFSTFQSLKGHWTAKTEMWGFFPVLVTFERVMESVLAGWQWQICLINLDNEIFFGRMFDEMLKNLEKVLSWVNVKCQKVQLVCPSVKIRGIRNIWERDRYRSWTSRSCTLLTPSQCLRTMFGSFLVIYYRTFIANCASIAEPLQKLKDILNCIRPPVRQTNKSTFLTHPDFLKPFMLDTDACEYAIGETLS